MSDKIREALARLRREASRIERDQHKYAELAYSPPADVLESIADDIETALAEQPAQGQNDDGLLPCPFCGSDEVSRSMGQKGDGSPWPYIECGACAAFAEPGAWNRRAEQPAQGDPCPTCPKGAVCRTPKCGRLKRPEQGEKSCEHGTVPAGMACEVCYVEWNAGRKGPPHPQLAVPTAPPAPSVSVPDALRESYGCNPSYINGWNACREAMIAAQEVPR